MGMFDYPAPGTMIDAAAFRAWRAIFHALGYNAHFVSHAELAAQLLEIVSTTFDEDESVKSQ